MVVSWDILYQIIKEVMTSIINKNSDINVTSFWKIEKLIKYFSCLKNDWIEPSRDKQKTFIKSFPRISKIHKLIKFKNYLNLVCPISKTYN